MKDQEPPDSLKESAEETPAQEGPGDQLSPVRARTTQSYALVVMTLEGPQSTVRRFLPTRRQFVVRADQFGKEQRLPTKEGPYVPEGTVGPPPIAPIHPLRTTLSDPDGEAPARLAHLRAPYQVVYHHDSERGLQARGEAPVVAVPVAAPYLASLPSYPLDEEGRRQVAPVVAVPAEFIVPPVQLTPPTLLDWLLEEFDEEGVVRIWWFTLDFRCIPSPHRRSIKLCIRLKRNWWNDKKRKYLLTSLFISC